MVMVLVVITTESSGTFLEKLFFGGGWGFLVWVGGWVIRYLLTGKKHFLPWVG